jgi:hypothetical protein
VKRSKLQSKPRPSSPRQVLGLVVLVVDLWRRLPPKRRRQVLSLARQHGPKLVKRAVKSRRGATRG